MMEKAPKKNSQKDRKNTSKSRNPQNTTLRGLFSAVSNE
jgi:hypothetical protein